MLCFFSLLYSKIKAFLKPHNLSLLIINFSSPAAVSALLPPPRLLSSSSSSSFAFFAFAFSFFQ